MDRRTPSGFNGDAGAAEPQGHSKSSSSSASKGLAVEMVSPQTFGRPTAASPEPVSVRSEVSSRVEEGLKIKGRHVRSKAKRCWLQTMFTARIATKVIGVGLMVLLLFIAAIDWPPWVVESKGARTRVMSALFICGLFIVATEDIIGINKSAIMLLLAATMWTCLAVGYHPTTSEVGANKLHHELDRGLQDVGSVILFLLPAMGVVESMDHFGGFVVVTVVIRRGMKGNSKRLMPIMCFLTFFLSSVIDNLTATIVALKILRHVEDNQEYRHLCGGLVVMAANAGGAWSAIGDVTTTMLWIQGKITPVQTIMWLFLPSLVSGTLPLFFLYSSFPSPEGSTDEDTKGGSQARQPHEQGGRHQVQSWAEEEGGPQLEDEDEPLRWAHSERNSETVTRPKIIVMLFGITMILMVPALKMSTGLPPYLGMLLALGAMWLLTDNMEFEEDGLSPAHVHHGPPQSGVVSALHKVDLTGLLFFTGVLLAVGALNSAGVLRNYAVLMVNLCGSSPVVLCTLLGISSSIVDNVPLVEAAIDMFGEVGTDDPLWQLVALAAGTGGSILSIGSIAGVTFMSMEGIGFLWFCRKITPWALFGFFLGVATYQLERVLLS